MTEPSDLRKCVRGLKHHQWDHWTAVPMPFDLLPEDGCRYIRKCLILGCNVYEKAQDLAPVGESLFGVDD